MDRRKQNRPPLTLLPFVVMLLVMTGIWMAVNGRGLNQGFLQAPPEIAQQLVAERVRTAVDSLKKGDADSARLAVENAIQIEGGTSSAVVSVTEELIRFDQPFAATVLANASQRPELNWDPMLWTTLAKAYERFGNKEEAAHARREAQRRGEAILQEIGKQTPVTNQRPTDDQKNAIIHLIQAGMYFSDVHRDSQKAFRALRDALRLWPDSEVTQNALGYTLVDIANTPKDVEEGLLLTKQAANTDPDNGIIRDSYGWALFRKGDLTGARRVLREASDLESNVPEIRYHLGMVYAKLGLTRQAQIELGRALDLRPDYPAAQTARADLKKAENAATVPAGSHP